MAEKPVYILTRDDVDVTFEEAEPYRKKLEYEHLYAPHEYAYLNIGLILTFFAPLFIFVSFKFIVPMGLYIADDIGSGFGLLIPVIIWGLLFYLPLRNKYGKTMANHILNELGLWVWIPPVWWHIGPLMIIRFISTVYLRKKLDDRRLFKTEPMRPLTFEDAVEALDSGKKYYLLYEDAENMCKDDKLKTLQIEMNHQIDILYERKQGEKITIEELESLKPNKEEKFIEQP